MKLMKIKPGIDIAVLAVAALLVLTGWLAS